MSLKSKWSEVEVEYLKRAYSSPVIDLKVIAKKLGRSHASVALKASRLGLATYSRPKKIQPELPFNAPLSAEDLRTRQSELAKARIAMNGHPRGMLGKKHSKMTKEFMSRLSVARWDAPGNPYRTEEAAQKRSDNLIKLIQAGKMKSGYSRSRGGRRSDLGGIYFRSAWEANYARYLNWLITKGEVSSWEFEPKTFVFEAIKRGTRAYTPDFKVVFPNGSVQWHEVKGWMDAKSETRLQRMAKYFPDEVVVVRGEEFFKSLNRSPIPKMISGWESGTVHHASFRSRVG